MNINNIVLKSFYLTEKFFYLSKKNNVVIFKVNKCYNKFQILNVFVKYFNLKVLKIRTIIVKKNILNKKNNSLKIYKWKKAYIFLKKGENLKIDNIKYK